jgi:hypothetical protein
MRKGITQTNDREGGGREGGLVRESVKNDTFISSKDQGKSTKDL